MRVRELIELLQREDPEAIVFLEELEDRTAWEINGCSRVKHTNAVLVQSDMSNGFELI